MNQYKWNFFDARARGQSIEKTSHYKGYLNPLAIWVSVGPELPIGSPASSLRFCLRK